jgi:hypothetical protein
MLPPPPEEVVKKKGKRQQATSDMPRSLQRMLQLKVFAYLHMLNSTWLRTPRDLLHSHSAAISRRDVLH